MSKPVGMDLSTGGRALGVLAVRGADAARFLQGQVSADTEKLAPGANVLAAFNNPQGRVIAMLGIARTSPDEFLAVLPLELVGPVAQRLGKFVFRSKVRIGDESSSFLVLGAAAGDSEPATAEIRWGERRLLVAPRDVGHLAAPLADSWDALDVAAGIPQVYAATSEAFVAQMLNLDLLGAIAFDKGCYTGQEVIARAHYRGRVKRRMQRWLNPGTLLEPGDTARGPDGRSLSVVRTAQLAAGQEILAVGTFAAVTEPAGEAAPAGDTAAVTVSGPLALPYSLPE
jgi:tRNA-modifying protein YgfZ